MPLKIPLGNAGRSCVASTTLRTRSFSGTGVLIATRSRATHRQETMQKIADQRESGQGLLTCVIMLRVGSNSKSRKSSSEQ